MTTILIDTKSKKEIAIAKAIAKEQGWLVEQKENDLLPPLPPKTDGKALVKIMESFVKKGGLLSFPKNASNWQREIRKDKKLFGRK